MELVEVLVLEDAGLDSAGLDAEVDRAVVAVDAAVAGGLVVDGGLDLGVLVLVGGLSLVGGVQRSVVVPVVKGGLLVELLVAPMVT